MTDTEEIRKLAMSACDSLIDCGYTRALTQLSVDDIPNIVKSTALHSTLLKVKAEMDQFMTGLQEAGVLHAIQAYPSLFRPLFVADAVKPMSAGDTDSA
jgi:hypothetical protein